MSIFYSFIASDENICLQPLIDLIEINPTACDNVACDCPSPAYECPDDSIFIETRNDECCVTYTCQCPDISCPLLMDSSKKVMPQPDHRGGKYSGRCCPSYTFSGIIKSTIISWILLFIVVRY